MVSVSQAIIGDFVPPRERGRYQGYFSSMYALASVAGPVLGGWLTEYLSWRWVFWINLPLGLFALWAIRRALAGMPVQRREAQVDYLGALLLILGLGSLLLGITLVGQGHAWLSPPVLALLGGALLGLVVFIGHERRCPEPLLPLVVRQPHCNAVLVRDLLRQLPIDLADHADASALPEHHRRRRRQRRALSVAAGDGAAPGRLHRWTPDQSHRSLSPANRYRFRTDALGYPRHGPHATAIGAARRGVHAVDRYCLRLAVPDLLGGDPERGGAQGHRRCHQYHQPVPRPGRRHGVACMSSLLLALLHQDGFEALGNPLLGSLQAGEPDPLTQARLLRTFRHLLMTSAALSLLGLAAALVMPDRQLRGR